jgi:hypothetical protein
MLGKRVQSERNILIENNFDSFRACLNPLAPMLCRALHR